MSLLKSIIFIIFVIILVSCDDGSTNTVTQSANNGQRIVKIEFEDFYNKWIELSYNADGKIDTAIVFTTSTPYPILETITWYADGTDTIYESNRQTDIGNRVDTSFTYKRMKWQDGKRIVYDYDDSNKPEGYVWRTNTFEYDKSGLIRYYTESDFSNIEIKTDINDKMYRIHTTDRQNGYNKVIRYQVNLTDTHNPLNELFFLSFLNFIDTPLFTENSFLSKAETDMVEDPSRNWKSIEYQYEYNQKGNPTYILEKFHYEGKTRERTVGLQWEDY